MVNVGMGAWGVSIPSIELSNADREQLKRDCKQVMTRLVSQSPEMQSTLNRGENRAVRVIGAVPAILMGGLTMLGLWFARDLFEGLGILSDDTWRYGLGAAVGLAFLVFNPLAGWLDHNLMQAWSGYFIFRQKWQQGDEAARILDAAENQLRYRPEQVAPALSYVRSIEPKAKGLPSSLCDAVEGFPSAEGPPALIFRKFIERKYKTQYLSQGLETVRNDEQTGAYQKRYFLRARGVRNAIRIQFLMDELGAVLRAEIPTNPDWQRSYFSDPRSQETTLFDSHDLHQRFRTVAPHYRWPVATSRDAVGETALFRIITAVENPMRQPVYLITVKEVIALFPTVIREFLEDDEETVEADDPRIEALQEQYLQLLQTIDVTMFGKWDRRTLRPRAEVNIVPQTILRNAAPAGEAPDWQIRWDPNRINWSQFDESDGQTRRAFAVLVEAIDRAGKASTPITLTRGDALLIDNLRTLTARREIETEQMHRVKRSALYPQSWWLRGYYGFRVPNDPVGPYGQPLGAASSNFEDVDPDAPALDGKSDASGSDQSLNVTNASSFDAQADLEIEEDASPKPLMLRRR